MTTVLGQASVMVTIAAANVTVFGRCVTTIISIIITFIDIFHGFLPILHRAAADTRASWCRRFFIGITTNIAMRSIWVGDNAGARIKECLVFLTVHSLQKAHPQAIGELPATTK